MADNRINQQQDPLHSPVGGEADVESLAEDITSRQITAQTYGGDPLEDRLKRLKDIVRELQSRTQASERGKDLEPLLEEARSSLKIVERRRRLIDGCMHTGAPLEAGARKYLSWREARLHAVPYRSTWGETRRGDFSGTKPGGGCWAGEHCKGASG